MPLLSALEQSSKADIVIWTLWLGMVLLHSSHKCRTSRFGILFCAQLATDSALLWWGPSGRNSLQATVDSTVRQWIPSSTNKLKNWIQHMHAHTFPRPVDSSANLLLLFIFNFLCFLLYVLKNYYLQNTGTFCTTQNCLEPPLKTRCEVCVQREISVCIELAHRLTTPRPWFFAVQGNVPGRHSTPIWLVPPQSAFRVCLWETVLSRPRL